MLSIWKNRLLFTAKIEAYTPMGIIFNLECEVKKKAS